MPPLAGTNVELLDEGESTGDAAFLLPAAVLLDLAAAAWLDLISGFVEDETDGHVPSV